MKTIKLYTLLITIIATLIISCNDNREANLSPNQVYIVNSGLTKTTIYNIGESSTLNLGVVKSGYVNVPAYADIVVSKQALANYNAVNSTEFKALPEDCYTLTTTKVNFAKTQPNAYYPIEFNVAKLQALGNSLEEYVLPLELTSSDLQINFSKKFAVIQPVVKPATIEMSRSGEVIVNVDKNSKSIPVDLPVSIPFNNLWDITCTFTSTLEDFTTFNTSKGNALTLLPSNSYTMPESLVLSKGKNKGQMTVNIDRTKLSYASYCLPIRLSSTDLNGLTILSNAAASYILINTLLPIPRDEWKIIEASSESTVEGEDGPAAKAIDSDIKSFWHSAYESGAVPPHHIVIDMGKEWILGAVVLTVRNAEHKGEVFVSSDNITWSTSIGNFTVKPTNGDVTTNLEQVFPVTPTKCRYFKLVISSPNAQMRDIKASGGPAE